MGAGEPEPSKSPLPGLGEGFRERAKLRQQNILPTASASALPDLRHIKVKPGTTHAKQKICFKKKSPRCKYFLRQFNSEAGRVAPGWGTAPFMVFMMLMLFLFLLIILQIYNGTILLDASTLIYPDQDFSQR